VQASAAAQDPTAAAGFSVPAETGLSDHDDQSITSKRTRRPKRHFEFSAKDGV